MRSAIARAGLLALALVAVGRLRQSRRRRSFRSTWSPIADTQIPAEQQQEVANILEAMFGTPDEPFVLAEIGPRPQEDLQVAAGPVRSDQFGRETGPVSPPLRPLPRHDRRRAGPDGHAAQSLSARLPPGQVQVQEHRAGRQADRPRPGADRSRGRAGHGDAVVRPAARGADQGAGRVREVPEHARPDRDRSDQRDARL